MNKIEERRNKKNRRGVIDPTYFKNRELENNEDDTKRESRGRQLTNGNLFLADYWTLFRL